MNLPTIEIDADGNCRTLYADDLELTSIGRIENVRRASWIEWQEQEQTFDVIDARTGEHVYRNPNRAACIAWEIEHFSPGGKHYAG
jgi:hypothetical protein